MSEMVGGCCVCSDERGWDENPLVYCDGQSCNVAVHQACYGIVTVPSGPWFCRKCETHTQERSAKGVGNRPSTIRCELCPYRDGALKKTDQSSWAHVVCALYIPEVRFGNVTTMEPILISLIPQERFQKLCYICDSKNQPGRASYGACMPCNKQGCKQSFHVTCAQFLGLLCEEAGNMMDNVKYCGYCEYHYSKLKKTSNLKIIPPFRPVSSHAVDSPNSSPEKTADGKFDDGKGSEKSQLSIKDSDKFMNSGKPETSRSTILTDNTTARHFKKLDYVEHGKYSETSTTNSIIAPPTFLTQNRIFSGFTGLPPSSNPTLEDGDKNSGKEVSTLQLKEVPKDHSTSSSFPVPDHLSHNVKHDKPAPPDIKPHVTLTPIMAPVRPSNSRISSTKEEVADRAVVSLSTLDAPPTLKSENVSPDINESANRKAKLGGPPDLSMQEEINNAADKTPVPAKKARSGHDDISDETWVRDDDNASEPRVMGRGSYMNRKQFDAFQPPAFDTVGNSSPGRSTPLSEARPPIKRGPGRPPRLPGPGRLDEDHNKPAPKPGRGRRGGKARNLIRTGRQEDPPAPTLSQLKQQQNEAATTSTVPVHMFGNTLNPSSSMAKRMVDTLSQEMADVAAANGSGVEPPPPPKLVGVAVPGKQQRSSPLISPSSKILRRDDASNGSHSAPQTLEQLLERQWEQGSQFLMEQAQHLDIAQLLSCLNQLKQDNKALEEHVQSLTQRRDQLTALNARLSMPLNNTPTSHGTQVIHCTPSETTNHNNGHASRQTFNEHTTFPQSRPSPQQIDFQVHPRNPTEEYVMPQGSHNSSIRGGLGHGHSPSGSHRHLPTVYHGNAH